MSHSTSNPAIYNFKELHNQKEPLLLANVWNAHSAKLAQQAGFKALGTSSHAIANSLGYEDGEVIGLEELLFVIKRIAKSVTIPVSVDFEAGYSDDPNQVAQNVKKLTELGIVGINLEDGVVVDGERKLLEAEKTAEKIRAIKAECDIFINARIDTYITKHPDALEEAIRRAQLYTEAGADGIFVPLVKSEAEIKVFTHKVKTPLNVFADSKLPNHEKLAELGVKRISHGAKQYEQLMRKSEEIFREFLHTKNYDVVIGNQN